MFNVHLCELMNEIVENFALYPLPIVACTEDGDHLRGAFQ